MKVRSSRKISKEEGIRKRDKGMKIHSREILRGKKERQIQYIHTYSIYPYTQCT